jgi:hypothetical protein
VKDDGGGFCGGVGRGLTVWAAACQSWARAGERGVLQRLLAEGGAVDTVQGERVTHGKRTSPMDADLVFIRFR